MKYLPVFLTTLAILLVPAALSAADFEGRVQMKMTEPRGGSRNIEYRTRQGLIRTELETAPGQKAAMIMNLPKHEMIILMPEQQMYMVQSLAGPATAAAEVAHADEGTFEKTGESAKILGYDCDKYLIKSKDGTSELWLTDELGRFVSMPSGNPMAGMGMGGKAAARPKSAWERALADKELFPMRVVSLDPKGKEQMRLEVTAVEKGTQSPALFAPPAGYQKFDLGGMMQGLGLPGKR